MTPSSVPATPIGIPILSYLTPDVAIALIALVISFCTLLILRQQLQLLKWNQIGQTFHLAELWQGEHITSVRMKARQYMDYEQDEPISLPNITALPNYIEVSLLFITILNLLEILSIAVLTKVVDPEIAYRYFVYVLTRHYIILKPFIDHLRTKLQKSSDSSMRVYGHLEILAGRWSARLEKEAAKFKKCTFYQTYTKIEKTPIYKARK